MPNTVISTPDSRRDLASELNQTPDSQTSQDSSQLSDQGKLRVDTAGPNGSRCLISNAPANSAVEYAHVYPRRIMAEQPDLLDTIEYNWGLKRGTINLDTRRNVIKLNSNLHIFHDQPPNSGAWMLVPPKEIVQEYYDSVADEGGREKAGPFSMPDVYQVPKRAAQANTFLYNFVVIDDIMKDDIIVTQPATNPTTENIQIHTYPFDTLSPITSHLHYRFAILEIGRRLTHIRDWLVENSDPENTVMWIQIESIYRAWTTGSRNWADVGPDEDSDSGDDSQNDEEPNDDNNSNEETGDGNDSEGTGMRSVKSQNSKGKREPSLSPSSKRRAPGDQGHNCDCGLSCLSGETLNEYAGDVGAQTWDKGSISSWAQTVVEEQAVA